MKITTTNIHKVISHINARIKPDEMRLLFELGGEVPEGGTIVEIGSCYGASGACLLLGAQDKAHLTLVDNFSFHPDKPNSPEFLRANLESVGLSNFSIIAADSLYLTHGTPIDLLHIDGAHDFKHVWHDLVTFGIWAKVIVCHDYKNPGQPDVTRAIDEFLQHKAIGVPPFKIDRIVRRMVVLRHV